MSNMYLFFSLAAASRASVVLRSPADALRPCKLREFQILSPASARRAFSRCLAGALRGDVFGHIQLVARTDTLIADAIHHLAHQIHPIATDRPFLKA